MESHPESDVELMLRLADGHDPALNELILRWRERVAAFLLRMVGDHATAMDLTQETFVRLYQSRKRYRPSAAFSTYLFHIAANLARSQARWRRRHPTVPLETGEGERNHDPADRGLSPDLAAQSSEKSAQVNRAIADLPLELREALLLFTVEGLSQIEVARILDCSPKAVENRVHRARQALRQALAGET